MQIIRRDLKDPRIGFVSITEVRMSPDLRSARVRVSVLGGEEEGRATLAGLRSAAGLIRHQLEGLSEYASASRIEADKALTK